MARICTVCAHPQRAAIERALVNGESYRTIAARFSVSVSAVGRHKREHLPAKLAKAKEAEEVAEADDLLGDIRKLQKVTWSLLGQAAHAQDLSTALRGVGEARRNFELLARLLGELQTQPQIVNVFALPNYVAATQVLMRALAPYEDARAAASAALRQLGDGKHD